MRVREKRERERESGVYKCESRRGEREENEGRGESMSEFIQGREIEETGEGSESDDGIIYSGAESVSNYLV